MQLLARRSPVSLPGKALKTEIRDNWTVVLEYEGQGQGPYLVDLSHRSRWDVQDKDLSALKLWGLGVPEAPNHCRFENGLLINRMNRTQAAVWHLVGERLEPPHETAFTEVTDASIWLALLGSNIFSITEKLTALDLSDPARHCPFLLQGPFSHVPCQLVVFAQNATDAVVLFTCSRGYARDMVHAVLEAGHEFGLRPGGEAVFTASLQRLSG